MHLDNPIPFLATADAEQARTFYERVLGLTFVADEPPSMNITIPISAPAASRLF